MANFLLLIFLHIVYCISFFLQAVYAFFILYLISFFVFRSFFVGRGLVSRHALQAEVNSGAPFATCIFCIFAFCTLYFFLSFIIFLGLVSRHALEAEVSREGASFCHLWSQIVAQILHSVQPEGFGSGVSRLLNRKTSIYQTFQNIKPRTI